MFSEANLQTAEQLNDWLNDAQKWIDSYQEHTDERFVENRLRFLIIDLTNQFDLLQYSQFTIDWLQGLDERVDEDVSVENQELIYEIEYICQVLKPGLDKDLFTMLLTYAKQNRLG